MLLRLNQRLYSYLATEMLFNILSYSGMISVANSAGVALLSRFFSTWCKNSLCEHYMFKRYADFSNKILKNSAILNTNLPIIKYSVY